MEKKIVELLKDIKYALCWVVVIQLFTASAIILSVKFLADRLGG